MYKFDPFKTTASAKELFKEERAINHLEGWFILKEEEQKADEKYRNLVLPLCEITELTWKQIVFPIASFHMASGEEYKFLIFNKRRFERYYHEFKKSEP